MLRVLCGKFGLDQDNEANRLSARATRYARLGVNAGALAARVGVNRLRGGGRETDAKALASALGSMKGPLMKVAQMLTTIPDAVPADFAAELTKLQSQAPPMGALFVRRRMQAELGPNWRERFAEFDLKPAAAASLGQVHRAVSLGGERLACKLQYPDMASAVETDLSNLDLLFSFHRRASAAIDTREMAREIRERVREELDYQREAKVARLYRVMLADRPFVRVPRVDDSLSTRRLLTMQWLDGEPLVAFERAPQEARDAIAVGLFDAWWNRSCATASFTAIRISATTRSWRRLRTASVGSMASICSTMGACVFFRHDSCMAWSSSIARSRQTIGSESRTPSRCGALRGSRRE